MQNIPQKAKELQRLRGLQTHWQSSVDGAERDIRIAKANLQCAEVQLKLARSGASMVPGAGLLELKQAEYDAAVDDFAHAQLILEQCRANEVSAAEKRAKLEREFERAGLRLE